jgi:subtilisin
LSECANLFQRSADGPKSDAPWRRSSPVHAKGLPAWSISSSSARPGEFPMTTLPGVDQDWAWGGADGSGVQVCVLDTGITGGHPMVGAIDRSATVVERDDGSLGIEQCPAQDPFGHGTACAGVIRSIAPAASLSSVRVLTSGKTGTGAALLAGLSWAIDQGFDVINMSLATTQLKFAAELHDLADRAYFRRSVLVVAAHNRPVRSLPWTFSSVVSVACHDEPKPMTYYYNPAAPTEFHARGVRVPSAAPGGGTTRWTGNSFAAPHIAGICALILSKHSWLTPFQLKTVLYLCAQNALRRRGDADDRTV